MKIALNVKNNSRAIKPKTGDAIIFDGYEWYVTTKEDLLADAIKLVDEANAELERVKAENQAFKEAVSEQLYKMAEIMKKMQTGE